MGTKQKKTESLDIEIYTKRLDKKPTQSMLKSYLRLAVAYVEKGNIYFNDMDFGMPIECVTGLSSLIAMEPAIKHRITNISFVSIEEGSWTFNY